MVRNIQTASAHDAGVKDRFIISKYWKVVSELFSLSTHNFTTQRPSFIYTAPCTPPGTKQDLDYLPCSSELHFQSLYHSSSLRQGPYPAGLTLPW